MTETEIKDAIIKWGARQMGLSDAFELYGHKDASEKMMHAWSAAVDILADVFKMDAGDAVTMMTEENIRNKKERKNG